MEQLQGYFAFWAITLLCSAISIIPMFYSFIKDDDVGMLFCGLLLIMITMAIGQIVYLT